MSEFSRDHNRVVWFDLPVADLDRAVKFYKAVLRNDIFVEQFDDIRFAVLSHDQGNGGCLVIQPENVGQQGPLIYLNVHGFIRDAVEKARELGGEILQDIYSLGPIGYKAMILDSEGNRVALHSEVDE